MKLLEMDRAKAIWNEYVAIKIIVIITKSKNNWLKLKFISHLINLKTYRDDLFEIDLRETKGVWVFEREGESLRGICLEFAKGN